MCTGQPRRGRGAWGSALASQLKAENVTWIACDRQPGGRVRAVVPQGVYLAAGQTERTQNVHERSQTRNNTSCVIPGV